MEHGLRTLTEGLAGISLAMRFAATALARRLSNALGQPLDIASALSMHAAFVGSVFIAYLALYPSAVAQAPVYGWAVLDKRWLIATYSLGVLILVVLPVFLCRLIRAGDPRGAEVARCRTEVGAGRSGTLAAAGPASTSITLVDPHEGRSRARSCGIAATRVILGLLLAATLATYLFHPYFFVAEQWPLADVHELVHLGPLVRMLQGHQPYVEAETQYGPGHQVLTYWLMRKTDFSLHGFRMSHLLLNLVSAIVVYAIVFMAFPWWIAGLFVVASSWVSPFPLFAHFGWGVVARWMGPFVVGAVLPLIIRHQRRVGVVYAASILLGAVWGVLAWVASENLSGGLLTFVLIMVLSWSIQGVKLHAALNMALGFFAGFVAVWSVFLSAIHNVADIVTLLALYLRPAALVAAGVSNTSWAGGYANNAWFLPYVLTPYVYIATGMAAIHAFKNSAPDQRRQSDRLQLLGMWSAAVILYLATMFRADWAHFIGPSLALCATLVLLVTTFPSLVTTSILTREALRAAILVLIVLIYPVPRSWSALGTGPGLQHLAAISGFADFFLNGRRRGATPADRLGFQPYPARCCSNNEWTSAQWQTLMTDIAEITAGRPTVVHEFRGTVPSAVYFFANLTPATSITEPVMSIWTEEDQARWNRQIERSNASCLVTTNPQAPLVQNLLRRFGCHAVHERATPIPYAVYCRNY